MPYEDSSPERRNLVVSSLCFIAFTFAGGEFKDDVVQLQVINAKFNNPSVLIVIVWIMLAWFIYRYWLINRGKFRNEFRDEFKNYTSNKHLENYISGKANGRFISDEEDGFRIFDIRWDNKKIKVQIQYVGPVSRNSNRKIISYGVPVNNIPPREMVLSGISGWTHGLIPTFECMFNNPSFSAYIVPYFLAALAIVGGILRLI